jgi:thiol-disulfide isomerase/thioredoxin
MKPRNETLKFALAILACLLASLILAKWTMAHTNSIIRGKVINKEGNSVSLYKVENGEAIKLGFYWPADDGCFFFDLALQSESIFFVAKGGLRGDYFRHTFYMKPGEKIDLQLIDGKRYPDFESCEINPGNIETALLRQWTNMCIPVLQLGRSIDKREEFITRFKELDYEADQLRKKINTNNEYFNRLLNTKIDVDLDFLRAGAYFYFTERMNWKCDTSSARKEFYSPLLQAKKYCDAMLINTDRGMQLMQYYVGIHRRPGALSTRDPSESTVADVANLICNDTLKGAIAIDAMQLVNSYEDLQTSIKPLEKYFMTPGFKEAYNLKAKELAVFARGKEAYEFSLPNVEDSMVSLQHFKGKIVVIDIWAMWCAPCLTEKPFFCEIEEEFINNDQVVFVSVSVDGRERASVWKDFIRRKNWNGIELISDPWESLMKHYKVKGIPRFIIIDEKGKIVTADAPRPSTPEFKLIIQQTLNLKS